jgi:hypothetical protein
MRFGDKKNARHISATRISHFVISYYLLIIPYFHPCFALFLFCHECTNKYNWLLPIKFQPNSNLFPIPYFVISYYLLIIPYFQRN